MQEVKLNLWQLYLAGPRGTISTLDSWVDQNLDLVNIYGKVLKFLPDIDRWPANKIGYVLSLAQINNGFVDKPDSKARHIDLPYARL